jgi:hypothetical protein
MPFPLIAAIGGIVKGAAAVIKKVKVNGAKKVASYNASIVAGDNPQAKKGFLGLFTGKKKIVKAQAAAFAEQVKAAGEKAQQDEGESNTGLIVGCVLGFIAICGLIWAFVKGGRKR